MALTFGPQSTNAMELDDLTLMRAQNLEPLAFQALVERYQDRVFALLWRVLGTRGNRALVEDLAQETFLGVYRSLPRFARDGAARLSTWILTIATRAALKELRRPRLFSRSVGDLADILAARDAADANAERRDLARALRQALDRLKPAYRAVFLLREVHEFAYEDIARALEIDVGTVKSRLSRARGQLKQELKEFEP